MTDIAKLDHRFGRAAVQGLRVTRPGLLPSLLLLLRTWRKRARDRAVLARLDVMDLRDIGVDLATVELEVHRPFWQPPLDAWRATARARARLQR